MSAGNTPKEGVWGSVWCVCFVSREEDDTRRSPVWF